MTIPYNGNYEPSSGGGLMPISDYEFVIVEAIEKPSTTTGRPMLELELMPTEPPYNNRHIWHRIMLDDPKWTVKNLGDLLDALDENPFDATEIETQSLKQRYLSGRIKHGELNGKPKNEIHYFLRKFTERPDPVIEAVSQASSQPATEPMANEDVPF